MLSLVKAQLIHKIILDCLSIKCGGLSWQNQEHGAGLVLLEHHSSTTLQQSSLIFRCLLSNTLIVRKGSDTAEIQDIRLLIYSHKSLLNVLQRDRLT